MTDNEIFETEIKCIQRRSSGQCNGGSDCCNCDLLMSDEEIISAYQRAIEQNDIINRQKAEIERLKVEIDLWKEECSSVGCENEWLKAYLKIAKAEAIKECLNWVLSLFPEDKNFTTISRFTVKQKLKEMGLE